MYLPIWEETGFSDSSFSKVPFGTWIPGISDFENSQHTDWSGVRLAFSSNLTIVLGSTQADRKSGQESGVLHRRASAARGC